MSPSTVCSAIIAPRTLSRESAKDRTNWTLQMLATARCSFGDILTRHAWPECAYETPISKLQHSHEECISNSASRRRFVFTVPLFPIRGNTCESLTAPGKKVKYRALQKEHCGIFLSMVKTKETTGERSGTMPYHAEDRGRPLFSECIIMS